MILVNQYFSETTPESAADGCTSDTGAIFESVPHTFRELVRLMSEHPNPSNWPANSGAFEWYSSGFEVSDYASGTERETTIHFCRSNKPHAVKYWTKAARAAVILKQGANHV